MRKQNDGLVVGGCILAVVVYIALSAAFIYGAGRLAVYLGHPFWVGVAVWFLLSALLGVVRSERSK